MIFNMKRSWLTLLIFVLFLGASPAWRPPASGWAATIAQERKFAVEQPEEEIESGLSFTEGELEGALSELPRGMPHWTMHAGFEPVDYFLYSLLGDEDWSDWQDFIRTDSRAIHLGSARRVLFLVSSGFMSKRPLSEGWRDPQKSKAYIDILRRMYYKPAPQQYGYLRLEAPEPSRSRWSLKGFLVQKEGLFSGRPWSWENFLPRLFTVAGMLLAGLLGVEFLRFIIRVGLRLGYRRRGGPAGGRE